MIRLAWVRFPHGLPKSETGAWGEIPQRWYIKMLKPKKEIISDKSANKFLDTIARIKKQRKEKKRKEKDGN